MTCRTFLPGRPRPPRPSWLVLATLISAMLLRSATANAEVTVMMFPGPEGGKVQATVSSLLTASGHPVAPGDTSFEDAAVLIGCDVGSDACALEVLATLSAEELVFGTALKSGEIVVQRVSPAGGRKQTRVRPAPGQDLEAALAPALRELYDEPEPARAEPEDGATDLAMTSTAAEPSPLDRSPHLEVHTAAPPRAYRRWAIVTWSGAGLAAAGGLAFWLNASSLQDDIAKAPDGTLDDQRALKDLESRAERASGWGNALMVVAAGMAGIGTYFWIIDRRAHHPTVAIRPAAFSGGGGLVVTIGAQP